MPEAMWVRHGDRRAYVVWWPRNARLHYAALCCGIIECVREDPCVDSLASAARYLHVLREYPHAPMQQDRIEWVAEWIRAAKAATFVG